MKLVLSIHRFYSLFIWFVSLLALLLSFSIAIVPSFDASEYFSKLDQQWFYETALSSDRPPLGYSLYIYYLRLVLFFGDQYIPFASLPFLALIIFFLSKFSLCSNDKVPIFILPSLPYLACISFMAMRDSMLISIVLYSFYLYFKYHNTKKRLYLYATALVPLPLFLRPLFLPSLLISFFVPSVLRLFLGFRFVKNLRLFSVRFNLKSLFIVFLFSPLFLLAFEIDTISFLFSSLINHCLSIFRTYFYERQQKYSHLRVISLHRLPYILFVNLLHLYHFLSLHRLPA